MLQKMGMLRLSNFYYESTEFKLTNQKFPLKLLMTFSFLFFIYYISNLLYFWRFIITINFTPLICAVKNEHVQAVNCLLANRNININCKTILTPILLIIFPISTFLLSFNFKSYSFNLNNFFFMRLL